MVYYCSAVYNLNQLKTLKPNGWQTYLANAGFQIYMATGAGDLFTSDHISRMTGTVDVPSMSRSMSDNSAPYQMPSGLMDAVNRSIRNAASGSGMQVTMGHQKRAYMLPEEVCEMGSDEMLVFAEGVRGVIRAGRKPYYSDPEFAGRYDEDPYHAKKS